MGPPGLELVGKTPQLPLYKLILKILKKIPVGISEKFTPKGKKEKHHNSLLYISLKILLSIRPMATFLNHYF